MNINLNNKNSALSTKPKTSLCCKYGPFRQFVTSYIYVFETKFTLPQEQVASPSLFGLRSKNNVQMQQSLLRANIIDTGKIWRTKIQERIFSFCLLSYMDNYHYPLILPSSGVEVNKAWNYILTSTPPYIFMMWWLIKDKENFALLREEHRFRASAEYWRECLDLSEEVTGGCGKYDNEELHNISA
jgi:hypothetical protein